MCKLWRRLRRHPVFRPTLWDLSSNVTTLSSCYIVATQIRLSSVCNVVALEALNFSAISSLHHLWTRAVCVKILEKNWGGSMRSCKLNGRVMKNNISLYFERTLTRMWSVEWCHLFAMILKDTEPHFKVTPMFDAVYDIKATSHTFRLTMD